MSDQIKPKLLKSQAWTFVELPKKSMEELNEMLSREKEGIQFLKENMQKVSGLSERHETDIQLCDTFQRIYDLKVEIVRQEEGLGTKEVWELEEISNEARRRVRHMENHDWDIVKDSDEANQQGFTEEITRLEYLEAAANLEMDRRQFL